MDGRCRRIEDRVEALDRARDGNGVEINRQYVIRQRGGACWGGSVDGQDCEQAQKSNNSALERHFLLRLRRLIEAGVIDLHDDGCALTLTLRQR
jgi:hypothetical protein